MSVKERITTNVGTAILVIVILMFACVWFKHRKSGDEECDEHDHDDFYAS